MMKLTYTDHNNILSSHTLSVTPHSITIYFTHTTWLDIHITLEIVYMARHFNLFYTTPLCAALEITFCKSLKNQALPKLLMHPDVNSIEHVDSFFTQ